MTKTSKTKTAAAPKKIELVVTFGAWVKKAKARGDVATLLATLRDDKKVKDDTSLKVVEKRYGTEPEFPTLVARYMAYNARLAKSDGAAAA